MGLHNLFHTKKSSDIARDRLKILLISDRVNCSPEMMEMYQKAAEAQKRIVMGILALPFSMLEKLAVDNRVVMTMGEDGLEMTDLTEEKAKELANYMQKAKKYLDNAMKADKVDTQSLDKKKDEETLHQMDEDIETIYETDRQAKDEVLSTT